MFSRSSIVTIMPVFLIKINNRTDFYFIFSLQGDQSPSLRSVMKRHPDLSRTKCNLMFLSLAALTHVCSPLIRWGILFRTSLNDSSNRWGAAAEEQECRPRFKIKGWKHLLIRAETCKRMHAVLANPEAFPSPLCVVLSVLYSF
jgi:hypothetical protein